MFALDHTKTHYPSLIGISLGYLYPISLENIKARWLIKIYKQETNRAYMNQTYRHSQIVKLMEQRDFISIDELVKHFKVTPQTINQLLKKLTLAVIDIKCSLPQL